MKMMENNGYTFLKQGAESKVYTGHYLHRPAILKERFPKTYRHPDLDAAITKERIRAEARSMLRCKAIGVNVPTLYLVDFQRKIICMEYIDDSITVKDLIAETEAEGDGTLLETVGCKIGDTVAKIHDHDIIHGDLTTSNMMLRPKRSEDADLYLIDFGLARVDSSAEDKGVDLYVLERAITSTHSKSAHLFPIILDAYRKASSSSGDILEKYEEIRARGRKRTMVG